MSQRRPVKRSRPPPPEEKPLVPRNTVTVGEAITSPLLTTEEINRRREVGARMKKLFEALEIARIARDEMEKEALKEPKPRNEEEQSAATPPPRKRAWEDS